MPVHGPKHWIKFNTLKNKGFSAYALPTAIILAGVAGGTALAQGTPKRDYADELLSLTTRQAPEYDPLGIRLGDFTLSPSIASSLSYDDNIYKIEGDTEGDWLRTVRPGFAMKSDFVRHSLDAAAFYERGLYQDITAENYSDYGGGLSGRIDVTGQTSIPFTFAYTRDHVRRGTPDELTAVEPTFFQLWDSTVGIVHEGQRIAMKMIAKVQRFLFDDTVGSGGAVINNADRDRDEYSIYSSIGMNPEAIFAPFFYTNVLKVDYDSAIDDEGFNRDAMQYEAGIGTIINFSRMTSASFTIGRLERTVDDDNLDDIGDFTYGVNVKWEPTPLASVLLSGDRTIKESTREGVTASLNSALRLTVDYELFPNLVLRPSASISESDYQGSEGGRTVSTGGGVQLTYKMNRNIWLTTSYQYTKQDEKEPADNLVSYKSNTYGVSLKLQF